MIARLTYMVLYMNVGVKGADSECGCEGSWLWMWVWRELTLNVGVKGADSECGCEGSWLWMWVWRELTLNVGVKGADSDGTSNQPGMTNHNMLLQILYGHQQSFMDYLPQMHTNIVCAFIMLSIINVVLYCLVIRVNYNKSEMSYKYCNSQHALHACSNKIYTYSILYSMWV